MKHLISLKSKSVIGTLTLAVATAISGCSSPESEDQSNTEQQQDGNKILTIEEKSEGKYVIVDEAPTSGPNKAIITDLNGTTQVLNEKEMQEFAQTEMQKVENGSSNLTSPNPPEDSGLSMGEVLLAGAAGALLGSVVGNMLSNNNNYQANQQRYNQSSSFQSRSGGANGRTTSSSSASKQSFFNKPSSSSPSTSKPNLNKSGSSSSGGFFGG